MFPLYASQLSIFHLVFCYEIAFKTCVVMYIVCLVHACCPT